MSESSPGPYDAAIADLESRIDRLQGTLDTLRQLRTQADGAAQTPNTSRHGSDADIAHDTFFGMTISDAARKYLGMAKATKSTGEIAEALERGGLKHSSKDFPTTVRSIIGPRDEFLRTPNGDWGLSEWYPNMRKEKKPKENGKHEKPRKSAKKKRSRADSNEPKMEDRIIALMTSDLVKSDWVSTEVAEALGALKPTVQSTMSRLVREGKGLIKMEKGYRLGTTA